MVGIARCKKNPNFYKPEKKAEMERDLEEVRQQMLSYFEEYDMETSSLAADDHLEEQLSDGELDLLAAQENAGDQYMEEMEQPEAEQPGLDGDEHSGEHFYGKEDHEGETLAIKNDRAEQRLWQRKFKELRKKHQDAQLQRSAAPSRAISKQQAELVLQQQKQPPNDDTLSRVLNDFADNMSEEVSQGVAASANARNSFAHEANTNIA